MARKERGAAAVEMAIVLPMLLLVIGGLVDFGRAFYLNAVITNASREGARMVAMGYDTTRAQTRVNTALGTPSALGSLTPNISFTTCPNAANTATARVSIPSGPANNQFHWLVLNIVPSLFGQTVTTPNLTATGSMRCGG